MLMPGIGHRDDSFLRTLPPKERATVFCAKKRKPAEMPFYRANSLPSLHLAFAGGGFNEYRVRQGCVEFRTNHGGWRLLEDCDVEFHLVLHTEVANWLQEHSTGGDHSGAAPGKS